MTVNQVCPDEDGGGTTMFIACCSDDCCPTVKYYSDSVVDRQVGITDDYGNEIRMSVAQFRKIQDESIF